MNKVKARIIMGIDPGTVLMGYGIIRVYGNHAELVTLGVIHLNKLDNHYTRLKRIYDRLSSVMAEFRPDEVAIEAPFFGKNVQSMLKLGRAQGVAMIAALNHGLSVTEYVPMRIKQAITGNGVASKEQVSGMLQKYLRIPSEQVPKELDATDGLAVALCHHFLSSSPTQGYDRGSSKNWAEFIQKNPERISPSSASALSKKTR